MRRRSKFRTRFFSWTQHLGRAPDQAGRRLENHQQPHPLQHQPHHGRNRVAHPRPRHLDRLLAEAHDLLGLRREHTHWRGIIYHFGIWHSIGRSIEITTPLATAVTNEMQGHGMRLHNTFEGWWRRQATTSSAPAGTASPASSALSRSTWTGLLFGQRAHRPVDYIAPDIVTSRRLIAAYFAPITFCPSDHVALGCEYDLRLDLGLKRNRPVHKPIGWWPQNPQEYDSIVATKIEEEQPKTISHVTAIIAAAAARVARTRRRGRRAGRSETEDSLRAAVHAGSATPQMRRTVIDMMWTQRHRIAAEKTSSAASAILRDLGGGGWGARHLTHACAHMSYLHDGKSKVVGPGTIELNAHAYYSDLLFSPTARIQASRRIALPGIPWN